MKIQIQDIMRANYVERWQLVNVSRRQTVAEHSFNVAMISKAIAEEMGYQSDTIALLISYAIQHDLDEVITGDIPTPTKQRVRELGVEMNDLIDTPKLIDIPQVHKYYKSIIKMADYLDAMWYLNENGVGRHAKQVEKEIFIRYEKFFILQNTELRIATTVIRNQINNGELLI